jgi:endonuclease-3
LPVYDRRVPRARHRQDTPPDANTVLEALLRHYPSPDTELAFTNPFELLVATVLSAQSTDKRVNETTPALFARYPDAATLAAADPADIEPVIHATGFFRAKSKAIVGLSQRLVRDHGGDVPSDMASLTALPGVGRKTANVVLGHALGIPGLPVDRHVLRVAERIGLTRESTPEAVERDLCAAIARARWTMLSDALILHGRRICRPTPKCDACDVAPVCRYPFKTAAATPLDLEAPPRGAPRRTKARGTPSAGPTSIGTRKTRTLKRQRGDQ